MDLCVRLWVYVVRTPLSPLQKGGCDQGIVVPFCYFEGLWGDVGEVGVGEEVWVLEKDGDSEDSAAGSDIE